MLDEKCLFCKIIRSEIPSQKVYEDDHALIFRDIGPKAPVHLLAIPKEHYAGVHEIPSDKLGILRDLYAAVSSAVRNEGLDAAGYRLVTNFGDAAGQSVQHIHIHILSGRDFTWPPG